MSSLVENLFDGQSNISDFTPSNKAGLKTEQNLEETKKDLKEIFTYILYSIEPQTLFCDANQPSAQDKLLIMDAFNYALHNHSTFNEEEIISFVNKLDSKTTDSFIFNACSKIKECCINGAAEEVDKFLNYLTRNIVTKGVDLEALGYLSKVEEIKKSDHDKTDEKGIDTIDVKILRDSQIYGNEKRRLEGRQTSGPIVRFEDAAKATTEDSKDETPSPITSPSSQRKFTEAKSMSQGGPN